MSEVVDKVTDPVCGMLVDPATALSAEHAGKTYHFCCEGCRESFRGDPQKYLEAKPFVLPVGERFRHPPLQGVIPAKAGIQLASGSKRQVGPRFRGDDTFGR